MVFLQSSTGATTPWGRPVPILISTSQNRQAAAPGGPSSAPAAFALVTAVSMGLNSIFL